MEQEIFDAGLNFWEVHPWFKSVKPFKEFYEGNEPEKSSALMWFLKYCHHVDSPFFQMEDKTKIKAISDSILGTPTYYKENKKEIDYLAEAYIDTVDTSLDRQLRVWKDKMDEKTEYMRKTTYDENTYEMLDRMGKSNLDQHNLYKKIQAERQKEKGTVKKGGGELSLTDSKQI